MILELSAWESPALLCQNLLIMNQPMAVRLPVSPPALIQPVLLPGTQQCMSSSVNAVWVVNHSLPLCMLQSVISAYFALSAQLVSVFDMA
jgi:hypothetical protein